MAKPAETRRRRIQELGFDYLAQPKSAVSRCNLCGHLCFVILAHHDRYGFPAQAHGCVRCGLVFLNPVMTGEAYRDFYTRTYRPLVSAYHGRRIDAETIQSEQRAYAAERKDLLEPYVSSSGVSTLLDIGGSTGVVAHLLAQEFGLHAAVLDPSPLEIQHAQQLGLETITTFLEEFEPGDRRFDLVTLCQTIDHLLDVNGAMRKVRGLLSTNGVLFADIVDFRAAYLRNGCVEEAIKIDHPFYLTEDTMRAYLLRAGFDILRIDYAADHLHVGYVCRLSDPIPDFLPPQHSIERLWHEVRAIQNSSRIS